MAIDPKGKTVLITGANRGIGLAYAKAFIDAGATKLYATARHPDDLNDLVDQHKNTVVPLALDLTKPETIAAAAESAPDVDIVVNNGGALKKCEPDSDAAVDNIDWEFDVNVKGWIRMAQAFVPVLKARGSGAIVQLNSVASLRNFPALWTYCATKAASYSLTQGLRDTLEGTGVDVVSVHPGPIGTDMGNAAGFDDAPPPSVVAEATIEALKSGEFHCFPDEMAKQMWQGYESFAKGVVEQSMQEA